MKKILALVLVIFLSGCISNTPKEDTTSTTTSTTEKTTTTTITSTTTFPLGTTTTTMVKVEHVVAVYYMDAFSPCNPSVITFEKSENMFAKTTECRGISLPKKENITEGEFNKSIYASFYLEGGDFVEINLDSLNAMKPHRESERCMQSRDKVHTMCYNREGVIVDIYNDYYIKGVMDANTRIWLVSIYWS